MPALLILIVLFVKVIYHVLSGVMDVDNLNRPWVGKGVSAVAKILVLEGNEVSALAAKFVLGGREVDVCATTCVETFCSLAKTGDFDIVIIGEVLNENKNDIRRIIETLWVLQESTDIDSVIINFSNRAEMVRIASITVPRLLGLSLLIDAVNRVLDERANPLCQKERE